jgi:hypothetical protein
MLSLRIVIKYFRIHPFSLKPLKYLALIFLSLLIILTLGHYEYFFRGYLERVFPLKGNLIALNLFILTLFMMEFTISSKTSKFRNLFRSKIFILYLFSAVLLASLGNRTWIICGILSFVVIYTNYYRRIPIKYLVIGFVFLLLATGAAARIRTGNFNTNWPLPIHNMIDLGLHDTFVVHMSLKDYLSNNEIQFVNFPVVLVSKLFKIIPTLFFPNKADLYYSFKEIGIHFSSIQAARHSFASLMVHFGAVGSMLLSFFLPFLLNYFKNSIYLKASYIVLTAHFAAPFFRDFDDFIIKIFLQICIIMPLVYLLLCNIYPKIIHNSK